MVATAVGVRPAETRGFNVCTDPLAAAVVSDVRQEIYVAAQPGQPDRNVERAAAHMLDGAFSGFRMLDDVDQRLTDHQTAGHAHRLRPTAKTYV